MSVDSERLSSVDSWAEIWSDTDYKEMPSLSTRRGFGRDLEKAMCRHLRGMQGHSFLEVGCYPGRFLRFFAERFELRVDGIEYVEERAKHCGQMLKRSGHQGEIFAADLFSWEPGRTWDVVASFGLVEHFEDTAGVLQHHLDLTSPGGFVVLTFPNHHGMYGRIMKRVAPDRYVMHNQMSLQDALRAANTLRDVDVVEGTYLGRVGFGTSRLYEWAAASRKRWPKAIAFAARVIERLGSILPNSSSLSPHVLLVLRLKDRR